MRVLLPEVELRAPGQNLAPRPESLDGKVVGFLDGWGRRHDDGTFGMYPLMVGLRKELERRFALAGVVWRKKPSISQPVPEEMLREFASRVDVVINGKLPEAPVHTRPWSTRPNSRSS